MHRLSRRNCIARRPCWILLSPSRPPNEAQVGCGVGNSATRSKELQSGSSQQLSSVAPPPHSPAETPRPPRSGEGPSLSSIDATVAEAGAVAGAKQPTRFSFLCHPTERTELVKAAQPTHGVVPNNDAKQPFPMWSSSLTSPKMELVRRRLDSWIAPHLSAGFHDDADVRAFVRWLSERADAAEKAAGSIMMSCNTAEGGGEQSYLSYALQNHVQLKLRAGGSCRGVFARRAFAPGDVILTTPTDVGGNAAHEAGVIYPANKGTPLWGLHLNSETLRRYSIAAQQRRVPSFETVWDIVSKRRSSLDPHVHPLFADQVYAALFLACEKEAGDASPLFPYLRLLPDPAVDDDVMLELHQGVLTPSSHLEYHDHKNRFHLFVYHLHRAWADSLAAGAGEDGAGLTVPPSQDTIMWAMRTVLARQLMLPDLRPLSSDMTDRLTKESTLGHILEQENIWMRNVTKLRHWWLQHVFRVLDVERMRQFEFNATTIPTVAPLFDMLQHDAKGGNVVWEMSDGGLSDGAADGRRNGGVPAEVLLVATRPIAAGQELTRRFRRCYSTSYTLFRYGFLAVGDREADRCADLVDAGHDPLVIGWDRPDVAVPRLAEATAEAHHRKARRLSSADMLTSVAASARRRRILPQ